MIIIWTISIIIQVGVLWSKMLCYNNLLGDKNLQMIMGTTVLDEDNSNIVDIILSYP